MMNLILLSLICVTLPCLAVFLQHGSAGIWKAKEQADYVLHSPGRINNPPAVINHALHSSKNLALYFNNGHVRRIMGEAGCL